MRGRKEVLWAVVISAALITAGLILSCGDDDGVGCKDVCEKLNECDMIPGGGDIEECIEACEDEIDPANEYAKELMECIVDTDCADLGEDCWCQIACEKADDCDVLSGSVSECVEGCASSYEDDPEAVIDEVIWIIDATCDELEEGL